MGPTDATGVDATDHLWDRPVRSMDKAAICPAICEGKKGFQVPSGKPTVCYGKSQFLMGKSTMNGHFFTCTRTGMMSIHLEGFWFYLTIDQMENYQWSSTSL